MKSSQQQAISIRIIVQKERQIGRLQDEVDGLKKVLRNQNRQDHNHDICQETGNFFLTLLNRRHRDEWRDWFEEPGIHQSMSRKADRLDNAATPNRYSGTTPEGRAPQGTDIRFVRAVQGRARRVHRAPGHRTAPGKARGTHPGGIPEHVPRGLTLYPN